MYLVNFAIPRDEGVRVAGGWRGVCQVGVVQGKKAPSGMLGAFLGGKSLTMTYFHTGCSTIIGAKSFHGPVRDGKGWGQLAMVIRHNG